MTVLNTTRSVLHNDPAGVQTVFPFTFKIFTSDDLVVTLIDVNEVETLQVISANYTLDGVGVDAGGNVTMLSAPGAAEYLRIERTIGLTQETAFKTQGNYRAETHENAIDRLMMILQQIAAIAGTLDPPGEYTTATKPAASATWSGKFILVRGTTGPTKLQCCLEKDTDDTYSWVTVKTGEF